MMIEIMDVGKKNVS